MNFLKISRIWETLNLSDDADGGTNKICGGTLGANLENRAVGTNWLNLEWDGNSKGKFRKLGCRYTFVGFRTGW